MDTIYKICIEIAFGGNPEIDIRTYLEKAISEKDNKKLKEFSLQEPLLVEDDSMRAYMGGIAEYTAQSIGVTPPQWCQKDIYFLKFPVFWTDMPRDVLVANTPSAFRRRLLFCGENVSSLFRR